MLAAALAVAAPVLAQAQQGDEVKDHVCVKNIHKFVTFRDPDGIKVLGVSDGKAEVIEYADQKMIGVKFTVTVNSKNEYGAYTGGREYQCYTSQDRQRVLNYSPRRD